MITPLLPNSVFDFFNLISHQSDTKNQSNKINYYRKINLGILKFESYIYHHPSGANLPRISLHSGWSRHRRHTIIKFKLDHLSYY
ncbi:MAG: hypothetical protein WAV41_01260 [Microgenomates group bacterium]